MSRNRGMTTWLAAAVLVLPGAVRAQQLLADPTSDGPRLEVMNSDGSRLEMATGEGPRLDFTSAAESRVKEGAPFSASTVSEHVQTLADGNRIRHASKGLLARDGQGRARRESEAPSLGLAVGTGAQRLVSIHDPVVGTNILLDFTRQVVVVAAPPKDLRWRTPARDEGGTPTGGLDVSRDSATPRKASPPVARLPATVDPWPKPVIETLMAREISGVRCEGTRSTVTVAAGLLGNERPLRIVTERWFSPELGVTVESRHEDPRFGTTTYKLMNLRREEPDRALFAPPPGWKVLVP
ncbi:hypothetical protein [Myxococcus stipitatus]|uniref:hypothetical protein n=1 Tax=Myxococcus stipitatus TaxID=83455 RepID=UPI0030D161ED